MSSLSDYLKRCTAILDQRKGFVDTIGGSGCCCCCCSGCNYPDHNNDGHDDDDAGGHGRHDSCNCDGGSGGNNCRGTVRRNVLDAM